MPPSHAGVQVLMEHVPPSQLAPHDPQLLGSVASETQAAAHAVRPPSQTRATLVGASVPVTTSAAAWSDPTSPAAVTSVDPSSGGGESVPVSSMDATSDDVSLAAPSSPASP